MPKPTLHLLDWKRPLLHAIVPHLSAAWDASSPLDLSDQLIVVPTRRSGRRLREALAAHAARHKQAVFPPRVVLPETLLTDALESQPIASLAEMIVAWIEVLRSVQFAEFDDLFPVEPADRGFAWANRLARQLLDLQATLGENGLRIADVPGAAGPFPEMRRWQQLADLERRHDAHLASHGLISAPAGRIAASVVATPPAGIRKVVIVASPDPHPLVLRRLEAVSGHLPIDVLVHGPALDAFDDWGRPVADAWAHRTIDLVNFEHHVHVHTDPSAQADAIVAIARQHSIRGVSVDGMLGVAVADREIVAPMHHGLNRAGIRSYDPEGRRYRDSELYRVLELLLALVEEPTFETAASLIRCPSVLAWLDHEIAGGFSPADLLGALDSLRATHLPASIADARAHALEHRPRRSEPPWLPVVAALDAIERLREQSASAFPGGVQSALAMLHRHRRLQLADAADAELIDSADAWADAAGVTADAVARLGRIKVPDTWQLALQQFGDARRFSDKPPGALELQGWLELHWDDAPHLIVAGLNDGRVPSAIVGDAFLPEALRERLGLKTNASRLARDAYLLHALVSSRSMHGRIDLLLGKTSAAGEPLRPSRLLLLCDDAMLPRRVEFLFREIEPEPGGSTAQTWRRAWRLAPPAPEPINTISVTAFRDHLACPFRFYLKHKLAMRAVDTQKEELDALDFGNLCHHALEGLFQEPAMRRCSDAAALRAFLTDRLDRRAHALYGAHVSVPMLVQLESARQRLAHAARVHAEDTANGWIIHSVEHPFSCMVGALTVTGRVDRIDRHELTGAIRVLDYKTFDQPKAPLTTHARKPRVRAGEAPPPEYACFTAPDDGRDLVWTDLQLPLYRRALAAEFGHAISVGYFTLPKAATETGVHLWEGFDSAWQQAADRCAEGVAAAITAGVFWPPSEHLPYTDEFESLFHQGAEDSVQWSSHPGVNP